MKPSRRTYTILAVIALLALQTLPIASAQLSNNVLYVYDHDPNSSNYYASIFLGQLKFEKKDTGLITVTADVWLQSYSGSGYVSMLRIIIGNINSPTFFVEFACINGEVYARIVVGQNEYRSPSLVPLDTSRYYPLEIYLDLANNKIQSARFYIYDGAGNIVNSWTYGTVINTGNLGNKNVYLAFGNPSASDNGLTYDLYVDNININSDVIGEGTFTASYDFDSQSTTPSLGGNSGTYGGYTTTTAPGNPQPIPEPWIAGVVALAVASTYLVVNSRRR